MRTTAVTSTLTKLVSMLTAVSTILLVASGCSADDDSSWAQDMPDRLVITTGNSSGIYSAYGAALGETIEQHSAAEVNVTQSAGSVDNLERLANGDADVAFSAADAVIDAVKGRGHFDEPVDLRSLGRVYDDFLHLVVPEDSPIAELDDLRGRRVAIGSPESGTALISHRLFRAAEIPVKQVDTRALSLSESIEAISAGDIDAFFWSGGIRTPAVAELSGELPIRLVPLSGVVEEMRAKFGSGYRPGTMLPGMYGQPEAVPTLAVPNMLVVRADLSEDAATAVLGALFAHRDTIADDVPTASLLDRAKAIFTSPVPLHPGATAYYRDTGTDDSEESTRAAGPPHKPQM